MRIEFGIVVVTLGLSACADSTERPSAPPLLTKSPSGGCANCDLSDPIAVGREPMAGSFAEMSEVSCNVACGGEVLGSFGKSRIATFALNPMAATGPETWLSCTTGNGGGGGVKSSCREAVAGGCGRGGFERNDGVLTRLETSIKPMPDGIEVVIKEVIAPFSDAPVEGKPVTTMLPYSTCFGEVALLRSLAQEVLAE